MFLYFLVLTGCDVLYINPEKDSVAENAGDELAALSRLVDNPYKGKIAISQPEQVSMTIPERPQTQRRKDSPEVKLSGEPLSYEELAKRASSVVMIGVYNGEKECYKTGSGVMIHTDGYILTNFHVTEGGAFYGIRFEEEEEIFYTRDLIKYHPQHDLAILKVEKGRTPIPLYREEKSLVRGQQVVAIGSPLGLFNSVSDGIISGFRQFEETSMIQFTAPTSHGSSGGALIDRYGRLIGLITGGFDDGQNLNLAVDYKTIAGFAGGLFGR